MNITKKCIQNNTKLTHALNIISKINYIQIEDFEKFNALCLEIAENLSAYCTDGFLKLADNQTGTLVAVNEMSVSYFDDGIISLKCDFTVSRNSILIFHRRYAVNYLLCYDILLIPKLVKGLGRCRFDEFFLTLQNDKLSAVPIIKRSVETPVKLGRKSQIDTVCNGKAHEIKIKLPHCLSVRKPEK